MNEINWKELREAFFKECVEIKENELPNIIIHPHNLFEWFKNEIEESLIRPNMINVSYLMFLHPELTFKEAEDLKKFSEKHTISFKTCYGNGEIMYPKWRLNNPKTKTES